jgi:Rrf2 family protein
VGRVGSAGSLDVYTRPVDLTLTRRGDYVLRAATSLAGAWDGAGTYRKTRDIAEDMALPLSYTPQILGLLARARLAESKAGPTGGHRLARPPEDISVLEVIEAAEGPLTVERCPMRGGPCRWDEACAFHPTWSTATEAMRASLARSSLAEVSAADADLASGRSAVRVPSGHRRPGRPGRP